MAGVYNRVDTDKRKREGKVLAGKNKKRKSRKKYESVSVYNVEKEICIACKEMRRREQ